MRENAWLKELIPGAVQGFSSTAVSYPFDTVKTHVQKFKTVDRRIVFNPRYLLRGIHISLFTAIPERAVQYMVYERFCGEYGALGAAILASIPTSVISVVGSTYRIQYQLQYQTKLRPIVYPIEVIRSSMSTTLFLYSYGRLRNETSILWASTLSTLFYWSFTYPLCTLRTLTLTESTPLSTIVSRERWGLWRGISLVYIRSLPVSWISMVLYEKTRDFLHKA